MPRLNANLSMMFTEVGFLDRFGAAARAGFKGVEFLFPYEFPAAQIREQLDRHRLQMVLFNMPPGDWNAGDRGLACDPGKVAQFQDGVAQALEYARALGCRRLHCMAGLKPRGVSEEKMRETYIANLQFAGRELAKHDITLLIEAINTRDIPGFYLNYSRQAFDIMHYAGVPNLKFQYDIYHMQIMEGDLAPTIEKHLDKIGHMQLADTPGRHEPGTGEINYGFLLPFIDRVGYQGWIGCEYRPAGRTEEGLAWTRPYL
ncbi:MAG TPA: 2-oxo-tetronate isomerase [Burkholderiales bacterium]|jgi:hydroxypyruvate isomerase|nr:2-oxo-tetronate isomerase [Burkholderiales bacterium]